MSQDITDCVWCCRAPEAAGTAHRLGGGQVEDRRRTPTGAQQHLLGAGQRVGPADRRTRRLLLFQRGAAALVRSRNR
jgi:hypothetical protein